MNTKCALTNSVYGFGVHLLWLSLRMGEVMCCMELLDPKASSGHATAALALFFVRLVLHWCRLFLL